VLSIVIVLAGLLTLFLWRAAEQSALPPPSIEVSAVYPGASPTEVADTVGAPIEHQVNGVEGMMHMSSQTTKDGTYTLTITFARGVDLNLAQVLVQNRVALAQPMLPDVVKRHGIRVMKRFPEDK
jgi:multidrug efflux pump subunit AcrB